jgi:hypothetical protein
MEGKMAVDKGIAKELSQLSKMWKTAQPVAAGYQTIPDGEYSAKITEMSVQKSKNGRLQVVTTFEVVDGEHEGSSIKRFDGLDNERSIGYFKGMAEIIGLDLPNDITLLPEVLKTFVDECGDFFEITVKTKNEYQNVYVNGVSDAVSEEGSEEVEGDEEEVEEEEIEDDEEEVEEEEETPKKKSYKR